MIYSSFAFIFIFLPITLIGALVLRRGAALYVWLIACSLLFYCYWNPSHWWVLVASIVVNYSLGESIERTKSDGVLYAAVFLNLVFLASFKYLGFFSTVVLPADFLPDHLNNIALPLGISFFTFQQIAYLIDRKNDNVTQHGFLYYALFIVFFPQLIAGPIVHQKEVLPQIRSRRFLTKFGANFIVGMTIFSIGLFKKVMIADTLSLYASPAFTAADAGVQLSFFEAWSGTLAFTFQLYFDFSGYSDMAVGLARIFNVRLPINFYSPYKARNIIDFWRRWHITLSRFLRDYLYIPLGGNRKSGLRMYGNLLFTMSLGGIWHGAGWTFILWGLYHGFLVALAHGGSALFRRLGPSSRGLQGERTLATLQIGVTFALVSFGWVLFKSGTLAGALSIYKSMTGWTGIDLPRTLLGLLPERMDAPQGSGAALRFGGAFPNELADWGMGYVAIFAAAAVAFFFPNTTQIMRRAHRPVDPTGVELHASEQANSTAHAGIKGLVWRPTLLWAVTVGSLFALSLIYLSNPQEFLYFDF